MTDLRNKFLESVDKLFERRQFQSLKELFDTMEPVDIAEILAEKAAPERAFLFRLLPKDLAVDVFEFMEGSEREEMLAGFTDTEVASIIEAMSDDDRTALFDELPAQTVTKLLSHLSAEERKLANTLLNYPADSAGHIMTPEFIDLKEGMTVAQAIDRIRATAARKETIYTSFVLGPDRRLKGTVSLEDLILAAPETPLTALVDGNPVFVATSTDQEEAAKTMSRYDLQTLPVVDKEERLVGILTFDDILDIVQEEATEDFERMAGIRPVEEGYMDAGVVMLARKRLTWLLVCIVTQLFSSTILERYTFALESMVALAFFIPLLIGTGGNAGSQTTSTIIRALAVGDIDLGDALHTLWHELRVGLLLGVGMALVAYGRALTWGSSAALAATVSLAILTIVIWANLLGSVLPLLASDAYHRGHWRNRPKHGWAKLFA